jgi:ankyrin repeat protein
MTGWARVAAARSWVAVALVLTAWPSMAHGAAGGAALLDAARRGDAAAAQAAIRDGADPNAREVDGTTALHWAAHRDQAALVSALIRAGADVAATNRYGVAPIALAATNGHAAILEALLAAGADANRALPNGETPIMTAARAGNAAALQVLIRHGADVNAREAWKQQTALMWAAAANNAEAVKTLIQAGADVHAHSRVSPPLSPYEPGDSGFSALLFAARAGHVDAARALLDAGADVNDTLLEDGTSALVLAVIAAQYDMAAFLLDRGADPNAAKQGWTALHQLAWTRRPNVGLNAVGPVPRGELDSLTFARKALQKGANVNARLTRFPHTLYTGRNALNHIGGTPFFLAAHRFDIDLMKVLVEGGADPQLPNEDGTTPLMAAAGVGLHNLGENPGTPEEVAAAVEFCLKLGSDPKAANNEGETALHGAAWTGSNRAVQLLVDAGVPLDVKNSRGWMPLTVARGTTYSGSLFQAWPETAAFIARLMRERGLPVEADDKLNDLSAPTKSQRP